MPQQSPDTEPKPLRVETLPETFPERFLPPHEIPTRTADARDDSERRPV
jgi:hypothetical protein